MKRIVAAIVAALVLVPSALAFDGDGGSGGDARYTGTCRSNTNGGQVVPLGGTYVYKICSWYDGYWYYVRSDGSSVRGED